MVDAVRDPGDEVVDLGRGTAPAGVFHAVGRAASAGSDGAGSDGAGFEGVGLDGVSSGDVSRLAILLRPHVPMQHYMGLGAVCALGVLDALRDLGETEAVIGWPQAVLGGRDATADRLASVRIQAGTGEAGLFAVCEVALGPACHSSDEVFAAVRDGVCARCDAWEADVNAGRAVAGPLAPVLSEYFDAIPLLGRQVEAVHPDGRVICRGSFAGIDVWGRATVHTADGEDIDLAPEQASLRES